MLPKLSVAGAIWRWDWAPMPVRAAIRGMLEAEVLSERVPVRVPVCGGGEGYLEGAAGGYGEGAAGGWAGAVGGGVVACG